jgi:hypothetical protein
MPSRLALFLAVAPADAVRVARKLLPGGDVSDE